MVPSLFRVAGDPPVPSTRSVQDRPTSIVPSWLNWPYGETEIARSSGLVWKPPVVMKP